MQNNIFKMINAGSSMGGIEISSDMYRQEILDHYRKPHNFGKLDKPDIASFDTNPACGDELGFQLSLDNENKVIDVRFFGQGCAISMASASMLSLELKGKTLNEIQQIANDDIFEMLGIKVGPARVKCALLCLVVLKKGIVQYMINHELPKKER